MDTFLVLLLCSIFFIIGKQYNKILKGLVKRIKKSNNTIKLGKKKKNIDEGDEDWESDFENADLKMVFVVRQDLKMGAGKIAAQVGHAAVILYDKIINSDDKYYKDALNFWNTFGSKKIVLKGDNLQVLQELANKCKNSNIPYILITDAGHTQIPAGSTTVLGIGVDSSENIDKITGNLKLMR